MDALIYNAGSGVWGNVEEVKAEDLSAPGASIRSVSFLPASRRFPRCAEKGRGPLSSSARPLRGAARPAQRRSLKARWRSARSPNTMARHLWPAGVHVALIVVDGVVGGPVTRSRVGDHPDDFFIDPAGVAAIAADLVKQDRVSLELRS